MIPQINLIDIRDHSEYYSHALTWEGNIRFIPNDQEPQTVLEATKEELRNEKQDTHEDFSSEVISVTVMPTRACNMGCGYCYAGSILGGEKLKIEEAETTFVHLKEQHLQSKTLHLVLMGGGEPLLPIRLVKEIYSLAKSLFEEVLLDVTTNGNWNVRVRDFLIETQANVSVTFDGVAQDLHRPNQDGSPSSSRVMKNIKALIEAGIPVYINCIVSSASVEQMLESVQLIGTLGPTEVKLGPVGSIEQDISRAVKAQVPDPLIFADNFIEVAKAVDAGLCGSVQTVHTSYFGPPSNGAFCGAVGAKNIIVAPGGVVSSCVEVTNLDDDSKHAKDFIYGHIDQNAIVINSETRSNLNSLSLKPSKCKKCPLNQICQSGCPIENVRATNTFPPEDTSDFTCTLSTSLIPRILGIIADNPSMTKVIGARKVD